MLSNITEVKEMKDSSKYPEWVKALKAGDPIFVSGGTLQLTQIDHVTEHYVFIKNSSTRFPKDNMTYSSGDRWATYTRLLQDTPERRATFARNKMFREVQMLASGIGQINHYRNLPMGDLEFIKEHMEVIKTFLTLKNTKKV